MKKIISAVLVCAMIFTLCACGKKDEKKHTVSEKDLQEMCFEPSKILDDEDYTVEVTDVGLDENNCCHVDFEMTNHSSEGYLFAVVGGSVNRLQCGPFMTQEVAAGESAERTLYLEDLSEYGVKYYTDIEMLFAVYLANGQYAESVEEKRLHIYPYGSQNVLSFEYTPSEEDSLLVDNDVISAYITGFDEDDLWGYSLNMAYVNKTDKNIDLYVSSSYINGIEVDPFYTIGISAQSTAFDYISWFQSDFDNAGITEINDMVICFTALDSDSGETLMEKEVTIDFE